MYFYSLVSHPSATYPRGHESGPECDTVAQKRQVFTLVSHPSATDPRGHETGAECDTVAQKRQVFTLALRSFVGPAVGEDHGGAIAAPVRGLELMLEGGEERAVRLDIRRAADVLMAVRPSDDGHVFRRFVVEPRLESRDFLITFEEPQHMAIISS